MSKAALVHELHTLEQLPDDLSSLNLRIWRQSSHEAFQISKRKVLHRNENRLGTFEPAIGSHEVTGILC